MQDKNYNSNTLGTIQIALSQYPILQDRIIDSMYDQLIRDGFATFSGFEDRVRETALLSQKREGLQNPIAQEGQLVWEHRLERVRSHLICSDYSQYYPLEKFTETVDRIVQGHTAEKHPAIMWHNLQFSAVDAILDQAMSVERMSREDRKPYEAQLMGAKVLLIRRLISDQLPYIEIAKTVFSISDLMEINRRKIGKGPIGGKAAGLVLANRILRSSADMAVRNSVRNTEAWYIGAEEFFTFLSINNLLEWVDQVYCSQEQLANNYQVICTQFAKAEFPKDINESLEQMLRDLDGRPFIVRSSSMLEDGFEHPFSGLYPSYLIPNQGSFADGFAELCGVIRKIYASLYEPGALIYRANNGLLDYPEKMAILIQPINGKRYKNYFFPEISGAGSDFSPYIWNAETNDPEKDAGFIRLSAGIGTRVTRRPGRDFSRFVILNDLHNSHAVFAGESGQFFQREIDVINLKTNRIECLDIQDVIREDFAAFNLLAEPWQNGARTRIAMGDSDDYCFSFDELVKNTNFTHLIDDMIKTIAKVYKRPIFIEFAVQIDFKIPGTPAFNVQINRCRVASTSEEMKKQYFFEKIDPNAVLMSSRSYVQNGLIDNVDFTVFIDADAYAALPASEHAEFAKLLGNINQSMASERFIFIASNRWGSIDDGDGIPVRYGDISNALALIEISGKQGNISDPLAGTQLFQHMMEAAIYSMVINPDTEGGFIDWDFFRNQPNLAEQWTLIPEKYKDCIRICPADGYKGFNHLKIALDRNNDLGTIYLQ